MDAGTAAVLGALAGSVATIGAALATGWAQREGARIAARAEHRRERRGPRQDVYKEFISAASAFRAESRRYTYLEIMPDVIDDYEVNSVGEAASAMKDCALSVALAGPRRVSQEAIKIENLAKELAADVKLLQLATGYTGEGRERVERDYRRNILKAARKVDQAIDGFLLRAQAALDDDGSVR
jgi:hypothetical protein